MKFFRKMSKKVAVPPGTLIHMGEKKTDEVEITSIYYDKEQVVETEVPLDRCLPPDGEKAGVSWINIDGLHNTDVIETVGRNFNLHPLIMEDILNTFHRPKLEEHEKYLYLVLKMIQYKEKEILLEQVSFILGNNFLISFQERPGDVFESVRKRIRSNKGRIRKMGADYLLYALMDAIVDHYFVDLEIIGEEIEAIEDAVLVDPDPAELHTVHHLKRELILLRRSIWPLREVVSNMHKGDMPIISRDTRPYLRDLYDHTIQVAETVETFRDMVSGLQDLYLTSVSNKTNEVMKVLTIIATIFIPITFITGIYGMNFDFMPELKWKLGYLGVWGVIILVVAVLIFYFKRKKWL